MVTFRNNNGRRNTFRRNDRGFKSSGERNKFNNNYSNTQNFQRKAPGRNNHNASKLIDKYNNLAREALSVGDKILSENYFQHADHFTRILNEKEIQKKMDFKSHNLQDSNNLNVEKVKKIERLPENENSKDDEHSEVN